MRKNKIYIYAIIRGSIGYVIIIIIIIQRIYNHSAK